MLDYYNKEKWTIFNNQKYTRGFSVPYHSMNGYAGYHPSHTFTFYIQDFIFSVFYILRSSYSTSASVPFHFQHAHDLVHGFSHTLTASIEKDDIALSHFSEIFYCFCPHAE